MHEGIQNSVPPYFVGLAFFTHSLYVSTTENFVQNSVGNFELGIGDLNDAMYTNNANEVTCTNLNCNKRTAMRGRNGQRGDWAIGP